MDSKDYNIEILPAIATLKLGSLVKVIIIELTETFVRFYFDDHEDDDTMYESLIYYEYTKDRTQGRRYIKYEFPGGSRMFYLSDFTYHSSALFI